MNSSWYIWIMGRGNANLDYWGVEEGCNPAAEAKDFHEKWLHLALTWDGKENTAYKNGEVGNKGPPSEMPNTPSAETNEKVKFILGGNTGVASPNHKQFFCGNVANIAVYDRALSADEVRQIYETGAERSLNRLLALALDISSAPLLDWFLLR